MTLRKEELRILDKIKECRTFQSETWEQLGFILQSLQEAGYEQIWNSQIVPWVSESEKYFLIKQTHQKVTVQASEFLGKYIQVEFHKPR